MARKTEFTKEHILQAAVELVRKKGISSLNARHLAQWANCSTAPIFRVFPNMKALMDALKLELDQIYDLYIKTHTDSSNLLVSTGIAYIEFAREEPYIFMALFMNHLHQGMSIGEIVSAPWNQTIILNTQEIAGLCRKQSEQTFLNIWLYSHGIATQMISSGIQFPPHTVKALVQNAFHQFIKIEE